MRAGRLKHRVTIKQPSTTRDPSTGAPTQTLTTIATAWSEINYNIGREKWANEHTINTYDVVITLRYRTDITEDMQVHYGSDVFEVKSVFDPYMNKSEIKLLCTRYER